MAKLKIEFDLEPPIMFPAAWSALMAGAKITRESWAVDGVVRRYVENDNNARRGYVVSQTDRWFWTPEQADLWATDWVVLP